MGRYFDITKQTETNEQNTPAEVIALEIKYLQFFGDYADKPVIWAPSQYHLVFPDMEFPL